MKRDLHSQAISNDEAKNARAENEPHRNQKIALHICNAFYKYLFVAEKELENKNSKTFHHIKNSWLIHYIFYENIR